MATYQDVATLASVLNEQLETNFDPDSLVFLIENYVEDEETPFTEVPISELAEQVYLQIMVADAFVVAQDGGSIEEIEEVLDNTAKLLDNAAKILGVEF